MLNTRATPVDGSMVMLAAMVMTDVSVVTDLLQDEEKRIKAFLEQLGNMLKTHGVSVVCWVSCTSQCSVSSSVASAQRGGLRSFVVNDNESMSLQHMARSAVHYNRDYTENKQSKIISIQQTRNGKGRGHFYTLAPSLTHSHTHTHARMHARTHAHMHTHKHTCTHSLFFLSLLSQWPSCCLLLGEAQRHTGSRESNANNTNPRLKWLL